MDFGMTPDTPSVSRVPGRRSLLALLLAIPVAGLVLLSLTLGTHTFTFNLRQAERFVGCFGYLLTDPKAHKALCSATADPRWYRWRASVA